MTSPDMDDEAMKAIARRIADHIVPERVTNGQQWRTIVERNGHALAERSALAAIIETQERDAALAESKFADKGWNPQYRNASLSIATAIRSGQHYGKDHPHA